MIPPTLLVPYQVRDICGTVPLYNVYPLPVLSILQCLCYEARIQIDPKCGYLQTLEAGDAVLEERVLGLNHIKVCHADVEDGITEATNELEVALFVELGDKPQPYLGQDYGEGSAIQEGVRTIACVLILWHKWYDSFAPPHPLPLQMACA